MESDHFTLHQYHHVKTKFLGNSLEVSPTGTTFITLKSTGQRFGFEGVWTTVHNIILGRMWVDHYGDTTVQEYGSQRKVLLKFKPCGWFSKGWHEVEGVAHAEDGKAAYQLAGLWNQNCLATLQGAKKGATKVIKKEAKRDRKVQKKEAKERRDKERKNGTTAPLDQEEEESSSEEELVFEDGKPVLLWQNTVKDALSDPYRKWGLSEFTVELLRPYPELPASDARLRPDRIALEQLDYSLAGKEKTALEEAQRERRRQREAKKEEYVPKWFRKGTTPEGAECWSFITDKGESYWDHRALGFPRKDPDFPRDDRKKEEKKEKEEKEEKK